MVRVLNDLQNRPLTRSNAMPFSFSALLLSERPAGARRKPLSRARLSQACGSRRRLECGFCLVPFGLQSPEPSAPTDLGLGSGSEPC